MTDKITLELTLDELKELDKNLYYCEETWSICDKIRNAYPKSPVVEAYKDWYGEYPPISPDADKRDIARWHGFQAGYNAPKEEKVSETAQERGERVHNEMEEVVRDSVKWCEEHPDTDPLEWLTTPKPFMNNCIITGNPPNGYSSWSDWYNELGSKGILVNLRISSNECKPTLKTPEETSESLKEAFREAVKQGVVSPTKSKTLTDLIYRWWDDIFTTHSSRGMETSIEDLVDQIELFLPKEQSAAGSQNAYVESAVEGFNDAIKQIKSKLR